MQSARPARRWAHLTAGSEDKTMRAQAHVGSTYIPIISKARFEERKLNSIAWASVLCAQRNINDLTRLDPTWLLVKEM